MNCFQNMSNVLYEAKKILFDLINSYALLNSYCCTEGITTVSVKTSFFLLCSVGLEKSGRKDGRINYKCSPI